MAKKEKDLKTPEIEKEKLKDSHAEGSYIKKDSGASDSYIAKDSFAGE